MDLITIKTFDSSIEAHLLKSKLESEGIECFIIDENIVTLNVLFSNATGGIKLQINSEDLPKATVIVNEIEMQKSNRDILECANCGSTEFYDFKSFGSVKGIISLVVTLFFVVYPIFFKRMYKCKKCGYKVEIPKT